MRLGLGRARNDVTWVNIWADADAARYVTGYRNGNETVPTAVTGSGTMIDANAAIIKEHLAKAAPGG